MNRVCFILLLILLPLTSRAENIKIYGRISDAETQEAVFNATITFIVNGHKQSILSDTLGRYSVFVPANNRIILKVSHVTYKPISRLIFSDRKNIIENFELKQKLNNLDGVIITAETKKLKQRNDTTVYYANAFKVNTDATAYDLITQKLQGLGIRDGKLEAHGETVKEILVDGKEYFKSDITMALKNLPADIIKEIQVFDQVSDFSKMTGFDDGTRKKTINILTKKGISDSSFGKTYGGYGEEGYYKLYGMINFFNKDRQLSIFAQDNNISEQNFSMIDLLSISGTTTNTAPQQSPYSKGTSDNTFHPAAGNDVSDLMVGGYSTGETQTHAIGTNYSNFFGKDKCVSLSGHYMFNNAINNTDYKIRDDYFSEGSNPNLQNQSVHTNNINHRLNTKVEWNITESDYILFRPAILYQLQNESSKIEISEEIDPNVVVDQINQMQYNNQEAISSSNELMFVHRFTNGNSLSANIKYTHDNTTEDIKVNLENLLTNTEANQTTYSINRSNSIAAVGSYIHPFDRNVKIKADIGWGITYREIKRKTNRNDGINLVMRVDSVLSGKTNSEYGGLIAGLSLLYNQRNHTQVVSGAEFHSYRMYSYNDITSNFLTFNTILPYIHVRHQWGEQSSQIHFQYKTEQTYPSMPQLQDAVNNINPTIAIRGNITLVPSYTHSAILRVLIPNLLNSGILIFFINTDLIHNYIANIRSTAGGALGAAEQRSQMMSYKNTNGYYSTSSLVAYGFPFSLIKSNINISSLIRYSHIPGFWESEKSYNKQINWNNSFTIGSNISKLVDFVIDINAQYLNDKNQNHSSLDVNYWTLSYGGQINWQFLTSLKVVAECGKTNYYGLGTNEMNATIWNMAVAYKFFKRHQAELRLSCDDILNQNNCFTQQTNELFRRKTTANIIGRHALLTLTYNFNSSK